MKPVFSASQPDWGATVRIFFSVLLSWIGGEPKDALRDLMLNTPCCQEVRQTSILYYGRQVFGRLALF